MKSYVNSLKPYNNFLHIKMVKEGRDFPNYIIKNDLKTSTDRDNEKFINKINQDKDKLSQNIQETQYFVS